MASTALVWFRRDLRLSDHAALAHALAHAGTVIPVFVWSPDDEAPWQPGAASRWWLHHTLAELGDRLQERGSRLTLRQGPAEEAILRLADETGADIVCWNERFEPAGRRVDATVAQRLRSAGIAVSIHAGVLLHDPDAVQTGNGNPYQVFTPFWKKLQAALSVDAPLPEAPLSARHAPADWPASADLGAFSLLPDRPWDAGLREAWTPGEGHAHRLLGRFLDEAIGAYDTDRNRPDRQGTSRLSPHLCFGEISPRQVWHAVTGHMDGLNAPKAAKVFLSELAWREFSYHLLYHFPHTTDAPLKGTFAAFPWIEDGDALRRWQKGATGFPIVDAGMRELWATGWMHNRVRMIVASFLTKDLLIPWQEGARWFWDTLVDADLANNTMGWQWSAGCGADAQPFFRIFNPTSQGQRFDPDGAYVARWVPELAGLDATTIHTPQNAPLFGADYPPPMVDHSEARNRALEAFAGIK